MAESVKESSVAEFEIANLRFLLNVRQVMAWVDRPFINAVLGIDESSNSPLAPLKAADDSGRIRISI
jgi:hypothetical protein